MTRWALLVAACLALGGSPACTRAQAESAVQAATSDDAKRQVFAVLLAAYIAGGNALIESSQTEAEAAGKLATYEDAWARVWLAYEAWRTLGTMDSFCMLTRIAPVTIPGDGLCKAQAVDS